jgi:broad specificity phosphatase PhoE
MMNQVDHPLTLSGANQVRSLGNKVAAWAKCLELEENLKAKLFQEEEAKIEAEEVKKIEKAEQAATMAMAAAIESVQIDLTTEKNRQSLYEKKKKLKLKKAGGKKRMLTANEMIQASEMTFRKHKTESVMAMYNQAVKCVDACAEDDISARHLLLTLRSMNKKITSDHIDDIEVKEALGAHIARLKTLIINRREHEASSGTKSKLSSDDEVTLVVGSATGKGGVTESIKKDDLERYITEVVQSTIPSPNFRENVKPNPMVDHLERKFMHAAVFSSPLTRALQTALLAMGPSMHPTLTTKGLMLISDAREVKKSRGSFDCVASVTGEAVRIRAVELLTSLRNGGDLAEDVLMEGSEKKEEYDNQNQPPSNSKRPSSHHHHHNSNNQRKSRRGKRGESLTREESALAQAEAAALAEIVVHPGDAGNDGIKWWSLGKEKTDASEERIVRLMEFIQLLPEADVILVSHSHLIREIFRMFAPDHSPSRVVKELQEKKLENCGVVALRLDFGPLMKKSMDDSDGSDGDMDDVTDVDEGEHGIGKNLVTDAVYLFGSACC